MRVWTWAAGGFAEKFAGGIPAGGAIECLLLFHPWLFAGLQAPAGTAGLVRVWQVETGGDQSLQGHMGTVFCLEQGGSYLFSGGEDLGLKVWQYSEAPAVPGAPSTLGSFVPAIELKGHQACIQDMKVTGGSAERAADVLISADRGGTVALWGERPALRALFRSCREGLPSTLLTRWLLGCSREGWLSGRCCCC